ncbi:uncharacterized protein LOC111076388 isoform X2 [Drosophila obscura]|uniref:uncharacterized protein LOC111076388 isoform X2 n=1 Tax=Drosophila obscura TaxID=7282 RepID=UPI001BB18455|nr:uncharacterized protein LOC111076388 isoform X2 [Drosophila obscura]
MQSQFSDKLISENEVEAPSTASEVRYSGPGKGDTNNHHVVPLGILMVLCTVYLVAVGAQRYYFEPGVAALDLYSSDVSLDEGYPETIEDMPVNYLRCAKLEIFGKETAQDSDSTPSGNQMAKPPQSRAGKRTRNGPAGGGASKRPRGGKAVESNRKKQEQPKKSNTAEPIIYLFALVFIYLLLKAASDINQHYKSNKGDKRLRRCSLQSYAQIHKQDRRASKVLEESPIFRRRHILLGEVRASSVDRYKYTLNEEGTHTVCTPRTLYHQHRAPAASPLAYRPAGDRDSAARTETRQNRRSSVPISIDYQTVHVSNISPYTSELARRGSVISLTGPNQPNVDPNAVSSGTLDPKRRVRMINRH